MNNDKRVKRRTLQLPAELQGMVWHIKPAATWRQLNDSQKTGLKKICDDFRPGRALICLFAGENGTDKSIAAEIFAKELDLDLFRIDLSAVVSKYIEETEKNLGRLFDAAEDGGWRSPSL